jgi:hypothetical protein
MAQLRIERRQLRPRGRQDRRSHEEHTSFPGTGRDIAPLGARSKKNEHLPQFSYCYDGNPQSRRNRPRGRRIHAQHRASVTKQGQEALSQAGAAATEMADSASRQVTTFASEITKMTRDNPLGALAGASMFGGLIGILLRGRSNSE